MLDLSAVPQRTRESEAVQELQRANIRMLAALNHEIRTPLTGILGMSDLLLESTLSLEQREYVQSTRLCAESLLESLSNALEYSAVVAGQLQIAEAPFHLQEVIRAAVSSMQSRAESRGISLQLLVDQADPGSPEVVVGDAVRLRQVVSILISHALGTCIQDEITVAVSTFCQESLRQLTLTVSVGDNGPDLVPEQLESLFAPPSFAGYTHARLELGLPLAFQLVLVMGGRLDAEVVPGSGTQFTVTLPLRLPETQGDTANRHAAENSTAPRLLLVEDNSVAQRFMRTVLERKGFSVAVAESGPAALEAFTTAPYDLVLMDVQMPAMDGLECTRLLRKLPGGDRVPIVACTANTSYEVRSACIDAGMDDFLSKPVQTAELLEIVHRRLETRG